MDKREDSLETLIGKGLPILHGSREMSDVDEFKLALESPIRFEIVNLKLDIWRYPAWLDWADVGSYNLDIWVLISNIDGPYSCT